MTQCTLSTILPTSNIIHLLTFTISLVSEASFTLANIRLDSTLSTTKFIRKYGYPAETHTVTTEDGYILEMHRIPFSPKAPARSKKQPVYLIHALTSSSADWVETAEGFGFILSDLGYDVWLGNARGNVYSRKHTSLDPNEVAGRFWDFSWHELGVYDNPAVIDYILAETGQPKLFYIGHSQGTTQFYVMASERPEYNDKIRAMISFAPVAFMSHARSPLLRAVSAKDVAKELVARIGITEIFAHSNLFATAALLCADGQALQGFCETVLFFVCGFDKDQLNSTMLPVIIGHTPAGSSTKQYFHYMQGVSSGKFCQYDYGRRGNWLRYGSEAPPNYNLSKVTAPVSLHYGSNDWLASTKDVDILHSELANPIGKFLVPYAKFNHIDFVWAIDAKTLLYDQVTALMADY